MLPRPVEIAVNRYLRLADRLLPVRIVGVYVIGSVALGAYRRRRSDIDLIVLFDQEVVRYRGKETAQRCFVRLTQSLARLLQEPTADGYVLRVDLPRPRSFEMESSDEFHRCTRRVRQLIFGDRRPRAA